MKPEGGSGDQRSAISSHGSRKSKVEGRGVKISNPQSAIMGVEGRRSRAKSPGGDAADPADAGPQGGGTALR